MIYRIEIWRYHGLVETYEDYDAEEVLRWYRANWHDCYEWGQCSFTIYKDDVELSFEEEDELGFH